MIPYLAGRQRPTKAELVFLDARFRKHDGRRGVAGGGFSPLMSPLGLARGSRAMIPYLAGR